MKFVSPLNTTEITTLQCMSRDHPLACSRTRANAVLLSDKKMPLQSIASLCGVCRQTVSIWLNNWEKNGICGLLDKPRRGRPKILSPDQEAEVIDLIKESPRSLNKVLAEIENRWGIKLSKSTLKRLCKQEKLSWKRMRRSVRRKEMMRSLQRHLSL